MKSAIAALVALGATALQTCDDWLYEDCSQLYWRNACPGEVAEGECGWWYWDDYAATQYWVTCDEFDQWAMCDPYLASWCGTPWFWEECSSMNYRFPCDGEGSSDCGWVYLRADYSEFWVTCDEFSSTDCLSQCQNGWVWEECSQMHYRHICDWEYENQSDFGWMYLRADSSEFMVTYDEFYSTDCLSQCHNEWIWDGCSQMHYRNACQWELENEGDSGSIYRRADMSEFWITTDEYISSECMTKCHDWTWCNQPYHQVRRPCIWEEHGDDNGWYRLNTSRFGYNVMWVWDWEWDGTCTGMTWD